ncbi:MAG: helix-turn-helix domain-containing protein [Oscillospiraceae bacterium]|nr:helix-turn-helix domain-containing protein [Oscillospiraceae bacterium]
MRDEESVALEISLALILDELGLEADRHIEEKANPKFRSAELFVAGEARYPADTLFVCPLSEAMAADKPDGVFFLCVRDGATFGRENVQPIKDITVVRGEICLRDLFNRVLRVFVRIAEWISAMERSVAKRSGLQELLDLSEPVFRNFITIQDSTFKLIDYTKKITSPGVVMARLVQHGFHPPETMDLLRHHRRLEEYKTNTDVIINRDRVTSEFDVVIKTFHLGGSIFIMVVMECCEKPANNAVVEMFGILIEYIKAYADIEIAQTGGIAGIKALILDILEKSAGSEEEARVRSTYCGYPFEGGFRLRVFSFQDEDNVPIAQIIRLLTESCRNAVALYWSRSILMLELKKTDAAKTCENAGRLLAGIDFVCGISNCFDSLWELPVAYEQAVIASDIASRVKACGDVGGRGRFHQFSDSLVYHVVSAGRRAAPGAFGSSFFATSIAALRAYDEQHRTETAKILRLFLENERNATSVASIMHMHRNTVLYHMEKINDILGVSLDDPDTRLQLLLAFKADDLHFFQ